MLLSYRIIDLSLLWNVNVVFCTSKSIGYMKSKTK